MYKAVFDNKDLSSGNYFTSSIEVNMPKSKLSKYELVRADGQIVTSKYYGERQIKVTGRIIANDFNQMQERLDTLKTWTIGYEKNLDITLANTERRYTATVDSFNNTINGYDCRWEIVFSCSSIGLDKTATSLTFGTYTTNNTSYVNTIGGTYKASPFIEFTVNSAVPYWSNKYIEIKNSVLNERIRITKDWNFGDKVVIDGLNKRVYIYKTSKEVIDNLDSITSWTSGNTLSLETANQLEGAGCSKIVMASAGTSTDLNKLNFTPFLDLSSTRGKIYIPVFIPTPTSGTVANLRFVAGSDATLANNYVYWNVTTQFNGSAIATNAWNYFAIDLSATPDNTTGTPSRTAIKSISVQLRNTTNFQLNGWRVDYISLQKPSIVMESQDFEGTFPYVGVGSSSLNVEDELTSRNITITGNYYKRYI